MKFKNEQEVHDYLKNSKVYVNGKTENIIEILLKYGFKLNMEVEDDFISFCRKYPFIYTADDYFLWGNNMNIFKEDKSKEILADVILSIELEEVPKKYEFKPFDKVLGRYRDNEGWDFDFFKRYNPSCPLPYICLENNYRVCIPYEGNENLVGKPYNHEDKE